MPNFSLDTVKERIAKKHPRNYHISATESTHCVLGYTIDVFVETEDDNLHYATDKAGRARLVSRRKLTPTYKSVRLQPNDSAVIIRGGAYDGHYVVRHQGEGWLITTTDISAVKAMKAAYAEEVRNYTATHAQYCYRGTFEVVRIIN
jgi:hypothetical protein